MYTKSSEPETVQENGASLAGRIIGDLGRIVRAELQIFEADLSLLLADAIDHALVRFAAFSATMVGGIFLLIAFILGLREVLDWWQSFAIAGVLSILAGVLYLKFGSTATAVTELPSVNQFTIQRYQGPGQGEHDEEH